MRTTFKGIIIIAVVVVALLIWAPWVTNDFAISKVVEKLGGPNASYVYLNHEMAVKDIPKEVNWLPFGRFVTFPGEAGWFVNFYGAVS